MISIDDCLQVGQNFYKGESRDTKPVEGRNGSIFLQLNGAEFYYLERGAENNVADWKRVGG